MKKELKKEGIIIRVGSNKTGHWDVINEVNPKTINWLIPSEMEESDKRENEVRQKDR